MTEEQEEYLTTTDARKLMDISSHKMAQLLKDGLLHYEKDPADDRVKLVKKADAVAWAAGRKRKRTPRKKQEVGTEEAASHSQAA